MMLVTCRNGVTPRGRLRFQAAGFFMWSGMVAQNSRRMNPQMGAFPLTLAAKKL